MSPISPADLANAVTSFATIFSGLMTLALTALMGRQPRRWLFAYLCIFITGLPTLWMHGFGEQFPARVSDIGTNLLLAWALQFAILGDYYSRRTQIRGALVSGLVNAAYVAWLIVTRTRTLVIPLGGLGGFTLGETLLISNSLFAVGLLYARHARIPARARPLLYLFTGIFILGALLATASNSQVDFRVAAWHALWHIVGAFGFIAVWAFNHKRFAQEIE